MCGAGVYVEGNYVCCCHINKKFGNVMEYRTKCVSVSVCTGNNSHGHLTEIEILQGWKSYMDGNCTGMGFLQRWESHRDRISQG